MLRYSIREAVAEVLYDFQIKLFVVVEEEIEFEVGDISAGQLARLSEHTLARLSVSSAMRSE